MISKDGKIISHIIFGLGQSGLSCARYFDRIEQHYAVIDTRKNPPGQSQLAQLDFCDALLFGEHIDEAILDGCKQLVVSPGIDLRTPLIQRALALDIDVCGDVEIFIRRSNKTKIVITGSNGKSTVTDLTERLLNVANRNCQKGGNIGLPVLDFLPEDKADCYVLELSSFQLDTAKDLNSTVAVLLNISEDHMDRYDTFIDYKNSKQQIFKNSEHKIFNLDEPLTYPKKIGINDISFSYDEVKTSRANQKCRKSYLRKSGEHYDIVVNKRVIISTDKLGITGRHNWTNTLACLDILNCLEVEITESVIDSLINYTGLAHRFQLISRNLGCEWINDSKATNVGSTVAALNSIDKSKYKKVILIAGGDSKNSDLEPLREPITRVVSHVILLGKDANKVSAIANRVENHFVNDMQQAVELATQLATSAAVILLSPACASLDMYKNFEARGDAFVEAVRLCA